MRTDRRVPAIVVICAVTLAGSVRSVNAQPTDQPSSPPPSVSPAPAFSLTPFFAFGDDLAPGGGAAFSIPWTRTISVEAEASLGTDAARTSVSLLYTFPKLGRLVPYAAAGGGIQRDEFHLFSSDGLFTRKKTEAAVNIGAGVTIPVSHRWSYRADFRWYNPKAEWPESWRAYSGIVFGLRRE